MSCFDWLDVGTFLDKAFGFPVSRFLGKPLNAFFFLLSSPFLLLHFYVFSIFVFSPPSEFTPICSFLLEYGHFLLST